jgi:lipid II:glycine glycyltransferase (peptidoglycan interpeptide bridge formation enzyme)
MVVREVKLEEKEIYNKLVFHPVQSWEWGEFKETTGVKVIRVGLFDGTKMKAAYQLTLHSIPKTPYSVGYFPKGPMPNIKMLEALIDIGQKNKAVFIKLEPQVKRNDLKEDFTNLKNEFDFRKAKIVFTPYTFQIDLTRTEDELKAAMKPKTRYNVRLAERNGLSVTEDNSALAVEIYLRLTRETARRQRFYAHDDEYHRKMWSVMHRAGIAHLLVARLNKEILTTWIVFSFKKVLYYPYGASSSQHRNLMANNLMMWEAMRFGKSIGCNTFDLWGSLGPKPDRKDKWYGFHRFKEGYGGNLVEFIGAYDLVIMPKFYNVYRFLDFFRWKWLRLIARVR